MKNKSKYKSMKHWKLFKRLILILCLEIDILLIIYKKPIKPLKLAICTMARSENLYIKEYIDYYLNLGFDHIYIFDDNEPNTENVSDIVNNNYDNKVTIYDYKKNITNQKHAYTFCYHQNKYKYDWIFMNDIDEYLVVKNYKLKAYLSKSCFKKCDFIKFHWIVPNDNDLLYYDNRSLFERFKGPYKLDTHVKTMVKGNISEFKFDVHTPSYSPYKNVSCNNKCRVYKNKKIFFQDVFDINIEKAYIIHFKYKSTEEFINKYKRGYKNWVGKDFLPMRIREYFSDNKPTMKKIEYVERELNLNLSEIKKKYIKRK